VTIICYLAVPNWVEGQQSGRTVLRQESPANAKVSARQPWYIGRNATP